MAKQEPKDETPKQPSPQQKPTIGRIVHFKLPGYENPAPAIVTGVCADDDSKVDLLVALPHGHPNGHTMSRPGVNLNDPEAPAEHTWNWPPRA